MHATLEKYPRHYCPLRADLSLSPHDVSGQLLHFTAATVEAYVMRTGSIEIANEAAKRLGVFMRILHHETKHTPVIGRSLDTIRRHLAIWKPNGPARGLEDARFQQPHNDSGPSHHPMGMNLQQPVNTSDGESDNPRIDNVRSAFLPRQDILAQTDMEYPQGSDPQLCDYDLSSGSGMMSFDFAVIDTGAGFHPDALPWSFTDFINVENNPELQWGQRRTWNDATG